MHKAIIGIAGLVMVLGRVANAVTYQQVAVKDAPVESVDPDASMGDATDSRLYPEFNGGDPEVKGIRPGFFQWDLSSIPAGSTVNSAILHLYLNRAGAPGTVTGYRVSRLLPGKDWVESTTYFSPANTGELTWNSQKHSVTLWQVPGAGGVLDVDMPGSVYFDAVDAGQDLQIAVNITSIVTAWVTNGAENNGVVLRGGTIAGAVSGGNRWEVGYRENADPAWRPTLTVEYGTPNTAPIVNAVDNHTAKGGMPYTRQCSVSQGSEPIAWSLVQGPPGAAIDPSTGLVSGWTPTLAQTGNSYTFEAKASNGILPDDTEDWQVTVLANPPVVVPVTDVSVVPGSEYTRQCSVSDGAPPITWSLVQGPTGAVIDANTGLVSGWTPVEADVGNTVTFEVRASNDWGTPTETWVVNVVPPSGVVYKYEMDTDVGAVQPDGSPAMLKLEGDGYGDLVAGDFNPPPGEDAGYNKSGQGNDCAVSARFSDTGVNWNDYFYLRDLGLAPGATGWTVDLRIWGEENVAGGAERRSAGLTNNLNQGRDIRIEPLNGNDDSLRITFNLVERVFDIQPTDDAINPTRFHMIRFVVFNSVNGTDEEKKVILYDLERWDDATGWLKVGEVSGADGLGSTHNVPGGAGGGLLLNSASNSVTTNSRWSADWVRIRRDAALGPFDPIIGGANGPCSLFADVDEDGDVDQVDFAAFQVCYAGTGAAVPEVCSRFDRHGDEASTAPDGDIDGFDRTAFENCATGPGVPADVCCDGGPGCPAP